MSSLMQGRRERIVFTLRQLHAFATVVEKGSLNKAADALFVSQPALTKQMSQLEEQLQCRLLIRKTTGVVLTEAGRHFYSRARAILAEVEQIEREMRQFAEEAPLRMGGLPSLVSYFLPSFIHELHTRGQAVEMIVADTTDQLIAKWRDGMCDVVFVQDFAGGSGMLSRRLLEEPYVAVLPVSHPLAQLPSLAPQEFLTQPLVVYKEPCDMRESWLRCCERWGIPPKTVLELDANESIPMYVARGIGISFVPRMMAEHLHMPALVTKPVRDVQFCRTIDVVYTPAWERVIRQWWGAPQPAGQSGG
ncbi:LysR family transcriptional regulator [Laceyella tengchongensis]|nr:LysR family transcriptional regulator [Laceyella tengchongensis]